MSKYIDMIGWDDCPHLQEPFTSKQELDDFESNLLPHQRQARRTGRPSLGAGAVYPVPLEDIQIEPFKIPSHWERGWAMDVGWNKTAAIFGARNPDSDEIYLTHEYYVGEVKPAIHAAGIRARLPWKKLEGGIDPAASGSNQKDGSKLRDDYEELGLVLRKANNAATGPGAGIHHTLIRLQSGTLKAFTTLTNFAYEYGLYRRNEKGKIVKENDHLMDCVRYLVFTDGLFVSKPIHNSRNRSQGEW